MPNIRIETRDPVRQMRGLSAHARAVRSVLLEVLTETQYRRVALLYGIDGEPLSERQAADIEGCAQPTLQESRDGAFEKLRRNGYLWATWLLSDLTPVDSYEVEEGVSDNPVLDTGRGVFQTRGEAHHPVYYPEDRSGWDYMEDPHVMALRPGVDAYETDLYNPAPSAAEAKGDGWLARKEGVLLKDNPYQRKDLHDAWAAGWREARDDDDSTS